MAGKVVLSYVDNGGEKSSLSLRTTDANAANIDSLVGVGGAVDNLQAAINGVTIGNLAKSTFLAEVNELNPANASSKLAQRENKWLVVMVGTTSGRKFTATMPCADLDKLADGTDKMDTALPEYTTLVNAIEAIARGENDESITVSEIRYVGRNL